MYGVLQDVQDNRDYKFVDTKIAKSSASIILPDYTDLVQYVGKIKDQKGTNACVAFSCATAREMTIRMFDDVSSIELSPMYLYYRIRQIMGTLPNDSGAYPRDGMKALATWGVPKEDQYPFDLSYLNSEPLEIINTYAKNRRIFSYYRIESDIINGIRAAIADGHPVTCSFQIFGSFIGPRLDSNHILLEPTVDDILIGGHQVVLSGYYDSYQLFRGINSWSANWANNGMFWIPYQYIVNHVLDVWVALG